MKGASSLPIFTLAKKKNLSRDADLNSSFRIRGDSSKMFAQNVTRDLNCRSSRK